MKLHHPSRDFGGWIVVAAIMATIITGLGLLFLEACWQDEMDLVNYRPPSETRWEHQREGKGNGISAF